jgi:hypothetical protein
MQSFAKILRYVHAGRIARVKSSFLRSVVAILATTTPSVADESSGALVVRRPVATIAGATGQRFDSLQAAIEAAGDGDTIQLGEGRFDERVTITKRVEIVGAGAEKTVLGPTRQTQSTLRESAERTAEEIDDAMRNVENERPRREYSEAETAALKHKYDEFKQQFGEYLRPIIAVDGAADVELRSLCVTMPDAPREGGGLQVCGAVAVKNGGVRMKDCRIIGCLSSGVQAEGDSRLELIDCLVAGCWGAGVSGKAVNVLLSRCDIRNNYHYNVSLFANSCVIEQCRISGSAWSGVSSGSTAMRVEKCAIFDNARAGIYSTGNNGVVRHNLIFRNGMGGACCWADESPTYESNVFLDNGDSALLVNGPAEPQIRKNLISHSPLGVRFGPSALTGGVRPPAAEFHVTGNAFWRIETPLALFSSQEQSAPKAIPLAEGDGNRVVDPEASMDDRQTLVIDNEALVRDLDLQPLVGLSLASRWPLTEEELEMIPEDGTRESSRWKKLPKLAGGEE